LNKKTKTLLCILAILATVAVVIAATSYQFTQTLRIPDSNIEVYTSSSLTTKLASGADLTSYWTWTGQAFTLTLHVKNVGTSTVTVAVTSESLPSTWTFTSTSAIVQAGATGQVSLTAKPPNQNAGITSGYWTFKLETT